MGHMTMDAGSIGKSVGGLASAFSSPANFFLAAGLILVLASPSLFDGLIGAVTAGIGAYYYLKNPT